MFKGIDLMTYLYPRLDTFQKEKEMVKKIPRCQKLMRACLKKIEVIKNSGMSKR